MKKLLVPFIVFIIIGGALSGYLLIFKNKLFTKNTNLKLNPNTIDSNDKGSVSGKLCFPSEFLPEGSIDAMNSTTKAIYSQIYPGSYNGGKSTYSYDLPVGTYFLRYTTKIGEHKTIMYGYHTDQCPTGSETTCAAENTRTNKLVVVKKDIDTSNIDICDFYYAIEKEPRFNLTNPDGTISGSAEETTALNKKASETNNTLPVTTLNPTQGIANPASTNCINKGGKLDIVSAPDGSQIGLCTLSDGNVCEEWAFFRNECNFVDDLKKITQALVEKDKINTDEYSVTIKKHFGKFASGSITPNTQQGGGGYYFAAKSGDQWKIVASGNGMIFCKDLTQFSDYPNYLIPECVNAEGNPVKR